MKREHLLQIFRYHTTSNEIIQITQLHTITTPFYRLINVSYLKHFVGREITKYQITFTKATKKAS